MNKQVHFFPSTYHTEETKIHDIAFANTSSSSQYTLYTTGVAGIIHTYNITLPSTTATPEIALVSSLTASRIEDEIISVFSIDVNTTNSIIAGLGDSTVSYIQHDKVVHVYHTNDSNNNELPSPFTYRLFSPLYPTNGVFSAYTLLQKCCLWMIMYLQPVTQMVVLSYTT